MPILKHFRGGLYNLLFEAKAAADIKEGQPVGVYISLQDGQVWVRRIASFYESLESHGVVIGPARFRELTFDEYEKEVKKREKKLGVKPRGWKPKRKS